MIRLVIVDDMPDIRNYLAEELAAASQKEFMLSASFMKGIPISSALP